MSDTELLEEHLIPGTDDDIVARYRALAAHAQDTPLSLVERDYVIMDTETTGLNPAHCSLIEIAAARVRGTEVVERFETLVNPGVHVPPEIVELTGITDADIADAPDPRAAVRSFARFVGGNDLVAHNASFDRAFVMRQAEPGALPGSWIDSLALAQIVLPRFRTHRLADLARAFGLHAPAHRAQDDVEALTGLWGILRAGIAELPAGLAAQIAGISPETDWPLRRLFHEAAEALPSADFSLRDVRLKRTQDSMGAGKFDADEVPLCFPSDEEVGRAFDAQGAAGRMYTGYERRDEQLAMALEVNEGFRDSSFRVLEAGTGVGKSMAYLLPCALAAQENAITVGVATKTNALMDQLVYHELPRLSEALGGLSYLALKGYEHYPCLRKVEHLLRDEEEADVSVVQMLAMLCTFTTQTSWGDLDAVNLHWYGLPRASIQANPNDCLKKRCPFYPRLCYLHGARRHASSADIVVTNHALLFRDLQMDNGILPPIRHWVVDEAHAVEDEARKQLSLSISARDLDGVFNRIGAPRGGVLATVRRRASELEGGDLLYGVTADLDNRIAQARTIATSFFSFVKELDPGTTGSGGYDHVTLWVGPELRQSGSWNRLESPGRSLADKLDGIVRRLRDLVSMLEEFEGAFAGQEADIANIVGALGEMLQALVLVLDGTDASYVYAAELDRDPDRIFEVLSASKLDVGAELAEGFYPSMKSVVYTSATLATASSKDPFSHFLRTVGLDRVPGGRVSCRALSSSYDFDHHMSVLLPDDIPEPNARGYRDALADLLVQVHEAMGGSVLTLFTNRRDMEELYHRLKPRLAKDGIELAAQLRGISAKSLRDRFLADESLSLFALKSFWEGFDAPGDTLRCVVIPKLPFGRPDDPIAREREARESRAAWRRYTLPEAIVDLKQAAGRLIRNSTDTGWLVLADARLQTKSYGKSFLKAMPTGDIRILSSAQIAELMREGSPGLSS